MDHYLPADGRVAGYGLGSYSARRLGTATAANAASFRFARGLHGSRDITLPF